MTRTPAADVLPPANRYGWYRALLGMVCAAMFAGCVTPWERASLLGGRETTIDNVQGPTERGLRNLFRKQEEEQIANGSLKPLAGTEAYLAAEELYEAERYDEAATAFRKVARKYKKSEIREDALFMEAESAYNLGHYARAQDRYSELLADYPSSRHLDDVSKRLFEIARMWLDFPEPATVGEVAQVNYDDFGNELPAPQPVENKKSGGPAFWPNLTDKSRPLFDPEGNGVGALRLIWLNDPTGPLADDALMLAASHYARAGNYIEADRHYTLLREEYPNSPHVQTAFVLGSHVKLMSYEGPEYDHKALEDSEHLKESILRLYPEMQDRGRIQGELDKIELAKAAREWELVVFYNKKGNPRAEAIYCHLLLQRYPETPFAKLARERLAELGPEYAGGTALLNPQPDPPKYRQTFGGNRPRLTNTPSSARQTPVAEEPSEQPAEESRRWGNPFRRGADDEPAPAESESEETNPTPRRFLPWGGEDDAEPIPTPESPGDDAEERRAETASDETGSTEGGSRWSRMFRFTPPRRLTPSREAEPIDDAAEAEMDATEMDSTETAVDPESEFEE